MRIPRSLSYSSMSLFYKDREEFYVRYLADKSAPRLPQEPAMAVGSSFDAYVKSALNKDLFGTVAPEFEFQTIFESQVEPPCRDFGLGAGAHVFECYKVAGAYADLLGLLQKSVETPRFEFKVDGSIFGVPFTGKPDCRFVLDLGEGLVRIILDWKVKGYCSKYGASPSKGYMLCRDAYTTAKQSKSHGSEHDKYLAYKHHGFTINSGYMEFCSDEYADQLCLYGWLMGETPGDEDVVASIEELVAKFMGVGNKPLMRVANHRGRVSKGHQDKLAERVTTCWKAITTGHIFTDMTLEESQARCEVLENVSVGLATDGSVKEDFFQECTRPQFKR